MTTSNNIDYLAIGHTKGVSIYNIKQDITLDLPQHACNATAFDIKGNNIIVMYSDLSLIEYDIVKKEYTSFCRSLEFNMPHDWFKRNLPIQKISYDDLNSDIIYLQDAYNLIIINKLKVSSSRPEKRPVKITKLDNGFNNKSNSNSDTNCESDSFTFIARSNIILYYASIKDANVLSIEVNPLTIEDKLPPVLKTKKFGAS